MSSIFVSVLLWTLVLVLAFSHRAGKEHSVLYSSIAIAVAMMMSIDELYVAADGWFGSADLLHLVSAIVLMVGVFFFARGVTRVGLITSRGVQIPLGVTALLTACALASAGFFLVERGEGTSTTFMVTYGAQPAAALYSIAQYAYLGCVLSAMLLTAIRQLRTAGNERERWLARLLMFGSVIGIALAVDVIWMDVTHVAGWGWALSIGQELYRPLEILTFLFLVSGLVAAPIVRWVRQSQRSRTIRAELERIDSLWREAVSARPSLTTSMKKRGVSEEHKLHRHIVEIRDAALDKRNDFALTGADRQVLAEVESLLLSGSS